MQSTGVYGARYNMFPSGDFFSRYLTLKMGQRPAHEYVEPILALIRKGEFDATDIITRRLKLDEGEHAYRIFDRKEDGCIKVVLKPQALDRYKEGGADYLLRLFIYRAPGKS